MVALSGKHSFRQKKKAMNAWLVRTSTRAGLLVFVVVFGILYVLQTNAISTKGFEISDLESNIATLEQENRRLDVNIASFRSMRSIEERLADLDMVPAEEIAYVTPVGSVVARR